MFPLKAIIALSMIFSSLAVGLVEPMPEAVAAAPVEAENAVAPREIELPNPLQACTPAGGRSSDLQSFATTLSFDLLQMVSHIVLPRFMQNIGRPHLLYRIRLHGYRVSFWNMPAPEPNFDHDP